MENVESYLKQLLLLAQPLAPLDLPLLDAHGATLASDIEIGSRKVLTGGSRIRSTHIGIAASVGLDHLPTHPHPRVVVISAGGDLTEPGEQLETAHFYEVNSWLLTTSVREAGAIGYRVHTIPTTSAQLQLLIEDQLVRADLIVITSGPESEEMTQTALTELGIISKIQIEMNPSGSHSFGLIGPDKTPVITLPTDPMTSFISFELFVRPMIRQMFGRKNIFHPILNAKLIEAVNFEAGAQRYLPAVIDLTQSEKTVKALALENWADANSFIIVPAGVSNLAVGELASVMNLELRAD
jgi:molybdopterin biosynthesis enzyme